MNSEESNNSTDLLIGSKVVFPGVELCRFRVRSLIAERDDAAVYNVVDGLLAGLAMKVQTVDEHIRELTEEFTIYRKLVLYSGNQIDGAGFPLTYRYAKKNGVEYLLMEKLGESLHDIANKMDRRKLAKKDVMMIGIHAVRLLRHVHKNGILHRDIRPHNFLMGEEGSNTERTLHLINFGEALTVEDWDDYDYDKAVPFAGTESFAPPEALLHRAPSRRGDMISLSYTLLFLAYGSLPWMVSEMGGGLLRSHHDMACQRIACMTNRLWEGFPALEEFVKAVFQIPPWEEPDYERLFTILEEGLSAEDTTNDGQYEWLPRRMLRPFGHDSNQD